MSTKPKTSKPSAKRSKPAAKAAVKAPRKPAGKPTPVRRRATKGTRVIRLLTRKCPHRPGTVRAKKWAALRNGQTPADAGMAMRKRGINKSPSHYLGWLVDNGFIKLVAAK